MTYADQLRTVVECFEESSAWQRTSDSDEVNKAVDRAANGGTGELFYRSVETDAYLHLRLSLCEDGWIVDGILDQPLDPCIDERGGEGSFTEALAEAHARIVRRYASRYVSVKTDTQIIAKLTVPTDFQWEQIVSAIAALQCITVEVGRLHTQVVQAVDEFE